MSVCVYVYFKVSKVEKSMILIRQTSLQLPSVEDVSKIASRTVKKQFEFARQRELEVRDNSRRTRSAAGHKRSSRISNNTRISSFQRTSFREQQAQQGLRMGRSNSRKRRHEENPSEQKQQQPPQQKPPKSLKSTGLSGVFSDLKPEKKQTTRIPVQPAPNDDCPNTWKGLVGNYQSHQFMKRLSSLKSLNGNVWVVWGATGAGKSSAVYLACKSKMWMHTLRAIGEPYLDRLDKFVRASRRHFKREVVVIDPLEEIIRGPSCVKRLCGIMRMAQERSTGLGFFIVCDDIYHKSLWPLRNNREMKQLTTKVLRFWPLRPDNIKKILIRHGVSTKARLEEGITISDGDGRRAVKFAKNGSHAGDRTINRFQACEALAEGRVRDVYRVDAPAPFLRFVTLNAPNMVGGDMDLCARAWQTSRLTGTAWGGTESTWICSCT